MKNRLRTSLYAAIGILALACGASVIPLATMADLDHAPQGSTVSSLNLGRDIYVQKCSGCHRLRAPAEHSPEDWPGKVERMLEKARLTPDEKDLVIGYLVAMSLSDSN
ncbi:MAG: hypothetical protein GXP54_11630 [Deltaproteobacteria bacterium]|nr:hypothetical protein [Deltaproteobacteria bacterium]